MSQVGAPAGCSSLAAARRSEPRLPRSCSGTRGSSSRRPPGAATRSGASRSARAARCCWTLIWPRRARGPRSPRASWGPTRPPRRWRARCRTTPPPGTPPGGVSVGLGGCKNRGLTRPSLRCSALCGSAPPPGTVAGRVWKGLGVDTTGLSLRCGASCVRAPHHLGPCQVGLRNGRLLTRWCAVAQTP